MSEPVARTVSPAASAAPDPPEDPPGDMSVSHGLRVTPHKVLWVKGMQENSGVVVRPCTTAPASKTRVATGCVTSATTPFSSSDPSSKVRPAIGCSSLRSRGTPSSGRAEPSARP